MYSLMVGESITCSDTEHTSAGRREAKFPRLSRVAHLHGRIVLIQKLAVLPDKPLVFKCEVFAVGAVHTSPLNAVTQIWQKRVRDARGIPTEFAGTGKEPDCGPHGWSAARFYRCTS